MQRDEPSSALNVNPTPSAGQQVEFSLRGELRPRITFPPLPHTVESVSNLLSEMGVEPNTLQLAKIVDSDPMVAASVLRRINSAYYGVRRRIASVQKAVMLLGFLEVANLVLTAGMVQLEETFGAEEPSEIFEHLMRTSIGTAQYARELANHLSLPCEGPAFSAGLLHAVGRLIMLHNDAEGYQTLWDAEEGPPPMEVEQQRFGIDHARLGAIAADEWKLPGMLIKAIRYYPAPDKLEVTDQRRVAQVVAAAAAAVSDMRLAFGVEAECAYGGTPELDALAEEVDADAAQLKAFVEKKRPRIRSYVDTMMQH